MPRGKKSRGGKNPNKPSQKPKQQQSQQQQQKQQAGKEKVGGVDAQKLMQSMLGGSSANESGGVAAGLQGGSEMFAKRAAESRNTLLSSATLEELTPKQLDTLWERFNAPEACEDESFEIWPDVAEAKQKKATATENETASTSTTATVSDANDDDDDDNAKLQSNTKEVFAYDSEEDETLEDIVYPTNLMPAVSERSMDDILGVPASKDGAPSLLARILDPDSGGKGKNKTGLHGLIAQPKKSVSNRERMRQRLQAQRRQRSGMTPDQVVYDKRGRRVRGARQVTEEDLRSGAVPSAQVNRSATRDAIRANIDKMRAQMAAEKQAKQQQEPQQP